MPVKIYRDEPIQWHLNTSGHDKCPRCRGALGYIRQTRRMCLSDNTDCGTWKLPVPVSKFEEMKDRGERMRYPLTDPAPEEKSDLELGRVSALRRAAKLVEQVCATLDVHSNTCESCGLKRHQNWEDSKTHSSLTGIAQKLRKYANDYEKSKAGKEG